MYDAGSLRRSSGERKDPPDKPGAFGEGALDVARRSDARNGPPDKPGAFGRGGGSAGCSDGYDRNLAKRQRVRRKGCPRLARGSFTFAATQGSPSADHLFSLSPAAASPPLGKGNSAGPRSCSKDRNHPPGKPGALAGGVGRPAVATSVMVPRASRGHLAEGVGRPAWSRLDICLASNTSGARQIRPAPRVDPTCEEGGIDRKGSRFKSRIPSLPRMALTSL